MRGIIKALRDFFAKVPHYTLQRVRIDVTFVRKAPRKAKPNTKK